MIGKTRTGFTGTHKVMYLLLLKCVYQEYVLFIYIPLYSQLVHRNCGSLRAARQRICLLFFVRLKPFACAHGTVSRNAITVRVGHTLFRQLSFPGTQITHASMKRMRFPEFMRYYSLWLKA
jgi:hypothetical protein